MSRRVPREPLPEGPLQDWWVALRALENEALDAVTRPGAKKPSRAAICADVRLDPRRLSEWVPLKSDVRMRVPAELMDIAPLIEHWSRMARRPESSMKQWPRLWQRAWRAWRAARRARTTGRQAGTEPTASGQAIDPARQPDLPDEPPDAVSSEGNQLRADLTSYLSSLARSLSINPWRSAFPGESPVSAPDLERTLRVHAGADLQEGKDMCQNADTLAEESECLVVLGGPGSGKTWLARRIARRAALKALRGLQSGLPTEAVEIPLFVTCEQFQTAPGSRWDAAIRPALESFPPVDGHGSDRLFAYLSGRTHGVLLILDSLDEATHGRGLELALIDGWRVVLTTRPGAWRGQWPHPAGGDAIDGFARPVVAEIEALSYPEDVRAFAATWFASANGGGVSSTTEPATDSEQFLRDLDAHPVARALSTIPLFLTFLCLVAPEGDLPVSRCELLDQVINRLLDSSWRGRPVDHAFDDELVGIAEAWAMAAAGAHGVHGLSEHDGVSLWEEDVPTRARPVQVPQREFERLDALAVPLGPPVAGKRGLLVRRFVHRVLREHLVACHVATLPTEEASGHLSGHWWFDENWKEVIPTAVVKHPDRDRLLLRLLADADLPAPLAARAELEKQTQVHLLRICAESSPGSWSRECRDILEACRIRQTTAEPQLVANSSHWHESGHAVVRAVIEELPRDPARVPKLVESLPRLCGSGILLDEAVSALLAFLPDAIAWDGRERPRWVISEPVVPHVERAIEALASQLPAAAALRRQALMSLLTQGHREAIAAVVRLAVTDDLRKAAVHEIVRILNERHGAALVEALLELTQGGVGIAVAWQALRKPLVDPHRVESWSARAFVDMGRRLDRREEVATVLAQAVHRAGEDAPFLAHLLTQLDPLAAVRQAAIQNILECWDSFGGVSLALALLKLMPDGAERQELVVDLMEYLPDAGDQTCEIVENLVELGAVEGIREQLVRACVAHLPDAHASFGLGSSWFRTTELLELLVTTKQARDAAVDGLAGLLPQVGGSLLRDLIKLLLEVATTEDARAAAARALITHKPVNGGEMARALVALDPPEPTRSSAVEALLGYLAVSHQPVDDIALAVVELDPGSAARSAAVHALIDRLPKADIFGPSQEVRALKALATTDDTRPAAVKALIDCLLQRPPGWIGQDEIINALRVLSTTPATVRETVAALLQCLPEAPSSQVFASVLALRDLDPARACLEDWVAALVRSLGQPYVMMGFGEHGPAWLLGELATTETTRPMAVDALRECLASSDVADSPEVAGALVRLDPDAAAFVIDQLLQRLCRSGDPFHDTSLARAVARLATTSSLRKGAFERLARELDSATKVGTGVVSALATLEATPESRTRAARALTRRLQLGLPRVPMELIGLRMLVGRREFGQLLSEGGGQ